MLIVINKISGAVAPAPALPAPVAELPVVQIGQPAEQGNRQGKDTLIGVGPARAKGGRSGSAPASFSEAVGASSGFALPRGLAAAFAPIVGGDLGAVRLHTDPAAQQASRAIDAEAFTLGQDIFFAPGRFNPGSIAGQALLAHELTHAEQFRSGAGAGGPLRSASPGAVRVAGHDRFERQAEANERFVLSRGLQRAESFGGAIHRKAAGEGMLRRSSIGRLVDRLFGRADGGISVRSGGPGKCAIERLDVVWADAAPGAGPTMDHVQARGAGAAPGAAPAGFGGLVAASAGQPLPTPVRSRAEALLGADFADVRVHTDAAAIAAAESVGAQAFALAGHIYFNAGRYEPTSSRGMALLIHELTHVEQERGGAPTLQASAGTISRKQGGSARAEAFARGIQTKSFTIAGHDRLERQAEANEAAVYRSLSTGGGVAAVGGAGAGGSGLRLARGYPGSLALSAEEETGLAVPDLSSNPAVQSTIKLLKDAAPYLGATADIAIGFVPVVGDVYDLLCGIVGRALFTWEQLDVFDRILCFAGVIPIPFLSGGILRRGKKVLSWMLSEARAVSVLADLVRRGVQWITRKLGAVRDWVARFFGHGPEPTALAERTEGFWRRQWDKFEEWRGPRSARVQAANRVARFRAVFDDKVVARARELGVEPEELLRKASEGARDDMRRILDQAFAGGKFDMARTKGALEAEGFKVHDWRIRDYNATVKGVDGPVSSAGLANYDKVPTFAGGAAAIASPDAMYLLKGNRAVDAVAAWSKWNLPSIHEMGHVLQYAYFLKMLKRAGIELSVDDLRHVQNYLENNQKGAMESMAHLFGVPFLGAGARRGLVEEFMQNVERNLTARKYDGSWASKKLMALDVARQTAAYGGVGASLGMIPLALGGAALAPLVLQMAGIAGALGGLAHRFKALRKERSGREHLLEELAREQDPARVAELRRALDELERPGLPLEYSVRSRLEGFLGEDLGDVRLHTGHGAERLAAKLGAHAVAVEERIVLGRGAWQPDTAEGLGTLVHEATHVLQDRQGRVPDEIGEGRRRALETEAYAAERGFVARYAPRERIAPEPFEPEYRREAAAEAAPPPEPKLAVPPSLSRSLAKAVDERPQPTEADPIQRVMDSWRVGGMSREEFLEICRERVLDLLHDELELDNERRETLAWNLYRPIA